MNNGLIPDAAIEAVLRQTDIVTVVSKHVHLTKQGKYLKGLCPFHSEKTPSFTVTPDRQVFHCYGCGKGGSAIRFIMEIEGKSFPEAVTMLAEDADIPVTWTDRPREMDEHAAEKEQLLHAHEQAVKWFHYILMNTEQGKPALQYLRDRGLSDKLISAFQIGYAPQMWDALTQFLEKKQYSLPLMENGGLLSARNDRSGYLDRFRDRVMFPLKDSQGRVVGFAARAMGDEQPKYLNTPETMLFHKSRLLYSFHQARTEIRKTDQVVLFEGYVDVIKAWEAGVHNGVASMGTSLTDEHVKLIKRHASRVTICYDGDDAGINAAYKSLALLEGNGLSVRVANLPARMDPDEYIRKFGAAQFKGDIIQGAAASTRFKLTYLKREFRLDEEGERIRYVRGALGIIARLHSPVEREHYLKELSGEFQISNESLKQELHTIIESMQKMKKNGDNIGNTWNNGRNERREGNTRPNLRPAYYNAERNLLVAMLYNRDLAMDIKQRLGDTSFHIEVHDALAAFIYRYYNEHDNLDATRFIATLQDDKLERLTSSLLLSDMQADLGDKAISDIIMQVRMVPLQDEIKQKKEQLLQAARSGDVNRAAQMGEEIKSLEIQLRNMKSS